MGRRISLQMQQHQPPGLAQCDLQHCIRPMHSAVAYAGTSQTIASNQEKIPTGADVWRGDLVSCPRFWFYYYYRPQFLTGNSSVIVISCLRLKSLIQFANTTNLTRMPPPNFSVRRPLYAN
jgi:hypothetical protein